jgi:hypothetical protein
MAKTIDCTPDRGAIRQNFEGIYGNPFDALCEGIDNSADYRPKCTPENPGTVEITFVSSTSSDDLLRVVLADDGRGIGDLTDWSKFLKIKRQQQNNGSSGAYGTGAKSMMDYLSDHPIVISKKDKKLSWVNYSESGDTYNVPVYFEGDKQTSFIKLIWETYAVDPKKNGTVIVLEKLKRYFDVKEVKDSLTWKYHNKLKNKNVEIYVGETNA